MLDTIAATIGVRVDEQIFVGKTTSTRRVVGGEDIEFSRHYTIPSGDVTEPRITYFPQTRAGPRLRVEVSLPKLIGVQMALLSQDDVDESLDKIDEYIAGKELTVPKIREWVCRRLDVVYSWEVGELLPAYIAAISNMNLGSYIRTPFGPEGVVWKTRSGHRWVKFYDKYREMGSNTTGILRFEVSNFRSSMRYMAKEKFEVPQTVWRMTRKDIAHAILSQFLGKVGVMGKQFGSHEALLSQLLRVYGTRGTPFALTFLTHYPARGVTLYKEPGRLMSSSTFYKWRKRLTGDGFLPMSEAHLDPLDLPVEEDFAVSRVGTGWLFGGLI